MQAQAPLMSTKECQEPSSVKSGLKNLLDQRLQAGDGVDIVCDNQDHVLHE